MKKEEDNVVDNTEATVENNSPEQKQSAFDAFRGKMKGSYPDLPDDDDEAFYGKTNEHLTGLEDYKTKNQDVNKKLMDAFNQHPELASFVKDVISNVPLNVALARNFDIDALKPDDGDEDQEAWNTAAEERKSKLAEKDRMLAEAEENFQLSAKEFETFKKDNNLTEDQATEFLESIDQFMSEVAVGKVSRAVLNHFYESMNKEEDVNAAAEAATIQAKNEKIELMKEKETNKGDSLPVVTASGEPKELPKVKSDPWADSIDQSTAKRKF